MIYLYGLMEPGAPCPNDMIAALNGVTGAVQSLPLEAGRLIYGEHDGSEIRAKRRLLLAHAKVLEETSRSATVLPMQFGLLADQLDDVAHMVDGQSDAISAHFERLAGHLEYGVRVAFSEQAALTHTLESNADLLAERERLARSADPYKNAEFGRKLGEALERRRTDAQHQLVGALKQKIVDLVLRAPETEYQVLNAHVLLKSDDEARLPQLLSELIETLDFAPRSEPHVSLVGPAPLYNFVRLNLAPAPLETA